MKLLAFITAIACYAAFDSARAADDAGKQAFNARCAKCHGESGTGTFMLGRRFGKDKALLESRTDLSSEFIRHVVRNGIVSMPALTRVEVTDDELLAVTEYLTKSNPPRL